ncbi:hypothetical protein PR048_030878 [Dryococelus australis]|uniref:PiggyBac transposable element-derived protein domain-containing protein n=1 Tax=Dryococelus australis TaxID=614101 RepID=A0ABQ9GA45_9NEOP|nr:hypothetical protein PR048_030878 [Dryococelus australis]
MKVLPSSRDYWSAKPDLHDYYTSDLMIVNRIGLYKIRPVVNFLQDAFAKYYKVHQTLVVDEGTAGRASNNTCGTNLSKGGSKYVYCVTPLASTYVFKFALESQVEKSLATRVVLSLREGFVGQNYHLFIGNFLSGHKLMLTLQENHIFCCGTINPSRKHLPQFADEKKLKRGEYDWIGKECSKCLNYHDPGDVITVKRKEKDGSISEIPCPKISKDYNANMNFVDDVDRLKNDYEVDRKGKKNGTGGSFFFHFVDAAVTNAYIVHKQLDLEKMSNKDFRRAVYAGLLATALIQPKRDSELKRSLEVKSHKSHVSTNILTQKDVPYAVQRRSPCEQFGCVLCAVFHCVCEKAETVFKTYHKN